MRTLSTIMDTNSFKMGQDIELLHPDTQMLTEKRHQILGGAYRLFYRNPVHLIKGKGQYLWDKQGNKYLDVYNNVASIGHCHPAVIEAVHQQMQQLNTHTRYLHERILNYSEDLLCTTPDEISKAMYMCTGSEANDLAIRVARAYSGGTGIIVTQEAYHGTSELTSGASPALGSGQPLSPTTSLVKAPDQYRVKTKDIGIWFAKQIQLKIDEMNSKGIKFAGFLADSIFSSDGVLPTPSGYLKPAIDVIHANGGIFIADEVQPGFARTGESFWGFGRHDIVPDIITTGKPMGNGIPISGLLAKADVLSAFSDQIPYFNTFGGNPVAIAAAQAVLKVIQEENLQEHSQKVGTKLLNELKKLFDRHECVGDIRGSGLFIGFEIVKNRDTKAPNKQRALDVVEHLRNSHVLTSVAGPYGNVLKLRPPLAFQEQDIDWLVSSLDRALSETN